MTDPNDGLVYVAAPGATLAGNLLIPDGATGVVLFAHGSGSSRRSSRNLFVAEQLRKNGFATLLIDLLTQREDLFDTRTAHLRFDIELLADRLVAAVQWLVQETATAGMRVGLFGASTGAAAALVAASRLPDHVAAVVSRGGRPDLAGPALQHVQAPTLLIVGADDPPVVQMNRAASDEMTAHHEMKLIHGARHLFEEPGALEEVARLASEWFARYLQ